MHEIWSVFFVECPVEFEFFDNLFKMLPIRFRNLLRGDDRKDATVVVSHVTSAVVRVMDFGEFDFNGFI